MEMNLMSIFFTFNFQILKTCEDSYMKLYKFAFDADPSTLEYLEM